MNSLSIQSYSFFYAMINLYTSLILENNNENNKIVGMFLLAIIIMVISQTLRYYLIQLYHFMESERFYRVSLIFYLHFSS